MEASVLGADPVGLRTLDGWFNDLFQNRTTQFTPERLREMEESWRAAATWRARERLRVRRGLLVPPAAEPVVLEAEDLDALEDVFSTVKLPIGVLNMDYAGNNIRNVARVREVLADWNKVRTATSGAALKQRSELKLLGFADGRALTALGRAAADAGSPEEVARVWCVWLQGTDDAELAAINPRLLVAKRVFPQFWQLQLEVRTYFLANVEGSAARASLQTIELLCNARDVIQELSLDDFQALPLLLSQPRRLPQFIREAILDYQSNKGMRGWDCPDRRIVPLAWRQAAGEA